MMRFLYTEPVKTQTSGIHALLNSQNPEAIFYVVCFLNNQLPAKTHAI
jgi:hypothetical protein